MNLWTVFFTGLFTGGLTCLAVQGGLLAATLAQREEQRLESETKKTGNALPILFFLGAKLIAYTILGFLLGGLGSVFQLSLTASIIMQFAVIIFMFGTAGNLLNLHPIFRYFVIQPPRFLTRLVRDQSKSNDFFAPALLGAFTVFIPCGTTQAMMALAIASGKPILGALILFIFILGTSPIFFILGYFTTKLGDAMHQRFVRIAAYAIILIALFNLDGALALSGSPFTFKGTFTDVYCTISWCDNSIAYAASGQAAGATTQEATINIESSGYNPAQLAIKAGSQVTLKLVNTGGGGCTSAFTIPSLGIRKIVPIGSSDTVTFTAPNEPGGELAFMCSMGMFRGKLKLV
ncbi:sulfite exporter TauE/SafE family protein [Candidatus Gottesmanbacteria bacterium]|nr:sulfite exporter TauE/SafE family protein [Candidatus Gottesmanbacteria bacterium]